MAKTFILERRITMIRTFFGTLIKQGTAVCAVVSMLLVFAIGNATAGEKIKFAVGSDAIYYGGALLAVESGTFQKEGLDVQVFKMGGGSKAATAVLSGSCQFGVHSFAHVVKAQAKGEKLMAIACTMDNPGLMLTLRPEVMKRLGVTPTSPLKERYLSMKGLTIGVTSAGSLTNLTCQWMARQVGLDPVKNINIVALGKPSPRIAAMEKKAVDGLISGSHVSETIENRGLGKILVYTADIPELKGFLNVVVSARAEYLKSHPETARKFVRAIAKAFRMMKNDPEKALALAKNLWPNISGPVLVEAIKNRMNVAPDTIKMNEKGARINMKWMMEAGKLKKMLSPNDLFTNEFIE